MSLLEDLKEAGVLLCVDHVDVGVKIVVLQGLYTVALLLVLQHLLLFLLRLKRSLDQDRLLTNLIYLFLMELAKLLRVEQNLIQEFLVTSLLSKFLS